MKYLAIILLFISSYCCAQENLFYLTNDSSDGKSVTPALIQYIKDHANSINILSPQTLTVDQNENITGSIDPAIISLQHSSKIKLMPLLANDNFDAAILRKLFHNPKTQEKLIDSIVKICQQYGFYGIQLDFENLNIKDKNQFSLFVKSLSKKMHAKNFKLSVAVVCHTNDIPKTDFDRWYYENWSGSYDYKSLGKSADFISLMSYDRHSTLTTPGPIAPIDWVEKTIKTALADIPAKKISLGIPSYSGYWTTGMIKASGTQEKYLFRSKLNQIPYSQVEALLIQYQIKPVWSNQWKCHYSFFSIDNRMQYLFIEDAKSIAAKRKLVDRYNLLGISVWKIQTADLHMWENGEKNAGNH